MFGAVQARCAEEQQYRLSQSRRPGVSVAAEDDTLSEFERNIDRYIRDWGFWRTVLSEDLGLPLDTLPGAVPTGNPAARRESVIAELKTFGSGTKPASTPVPPVVPSSGSMTNMRRASLARRNSVASVSSASWARGEDAAAAERESGGAAARRGRRSLGSTRSSMDTWQSESAAPWLGVQRLSAGSPARESTTLVTALSGLVTADSLSPETAQEAAGVDVCPDASAVLLLQPVDSGASDSRASPARAASRGHITFGDVCSEPHGSVALSAAPSEAASCSSATPNEAWGSYSTLRPKHLPPSALKVCVAARRPSGSSSTHTPVHPQTHSLSPFGSADRTPTFAQLRRSRGISRGVGELSDPYSFSSLHNGRHRTEMSPELRRTRLQELIVQLVEVYIETCVQGFGLKWWTGWGQEFGREGMSFVRFGRCCAA